MTLSTFIFLIFHKLQEACFGRSTWLVSLSSRQRVVWLVGRCSMDTGRQRWSWWKHSTVFRTVFDGFRCMFTVWLKNCESHDKAVVMCEKFALLARPRTWEYSSSIDIFPEKLIELVEWAVLSCSIRWNFCYKWFSAGKSLKISQRAIRWYSEWISYW